MPQLVRSVTATAIALLLAASFHPTLAKAQAAKSGDACSLITKEDAAAALGGAVTGPAVVGERQSGPGTTVSGCGYTGPDRREVQVSVRRFPAASAGTYRGICSKKTKDGLEGLGDLACWYNAEHAELQAFKGNAFVTVQLRGVGAPTDPIKAVMKKAIARLN